MEYKINIVSKVTEISSQFLLLTLE